jgi:RNA recognition motif-containing protein
MEKTNKLYVGGLSWGLEWQDLKDVFKEYWEVRFVKIIKDRETNRSKWYGFIEFDTVESAEKAKDALDGAEIDGRAVKIDFAQERQPREEETEA